MDENVPAQSVGAALSEALDQQLLEIIKNGRPTINKETGQIVHLPATAADLQAAMKRLQQLGIGPSADAAADETTTSGKLKKELADLANSQDAKRPGLRLNPAAPGWKPPIPPLDVEVRDAAGA